MIDTDLHSFLFFRRVYRISNDWKYKIQFISVFKLDMIWFVCFCWTHQGLKSVVVNVTSFICGDFGTFLCAVRQIC